MPKTFIGGNFYVRKRTLLLALVALLVSYRGLLVQRLARNLFTPGVPRSVEPRYPLADELQLAKEITVVVGTKDSVTPTLTQLAHLGEVLPPGVRVIYTYPEPLWEDRAAYAQKLREEQIDCIADLKILNGEDLEACGIPPRDAATMMAGLADLHPGVA